MKNKIFCLMLGVAAILLTACQSENEPMQLTNALADMVFYGGDGEAVNDIIGLTADELQDIFIAWTEITLLSELLPELPPEEDDLNEDEDEYNYDYVEDEEFVIPDLIQEMAREFLQAVQRVTTFDTRLMTLSPTHAVIGVSVAGIDIPSFYAEYFGLVIAAASRSPEISDDEFLEDIFDDYMAILANLQRTENPMDIFIEFIRIDGEWMFFSPDIAITQLYSALTANPHF